MANNQNSTTDSISENLAKKKPMKTPVEASKPCSKNLIEKLRLLTGSGLDNTFVSYCASKGIQINTGNLQKYNSGDSAIPLAIIICICEYYSISPNDLLSDLTDEYASITPNTATKSSWIIPDLGPNFVVSPNDPCFEGYLRSFNLYFLPTLENESQMLSGTLTLSENSKICKATLDLNINQIDKDGAPLDKHYSGFAIISTLAHTLYIILSSSKEGELCIINLRHEIVKHQDFDCGIAEVLTNSAGVEHYPTVHRMLLSREPINTSHLEMLISHLHFNASNILIEKNTLTDIDDYPEIYQRLISRVLADISPYEVYNLREEYIVGIAKQHFPDLSKAERLLFISKLRDISIRQRYNKASKTADESIHAILESLGYFSKKRLSEQK